MKPIEILREILCSVPEIEKDIKELRFGTKIILNNYIGIKTINQLENISHSNFEVCMIDKKFDIMDIQEIIGNPIQERHLRMYCDNRADCLYIEEDGTATVFNGTQVFCLDNTKDLQDQDDKVIQDIIDFLNK